MGLFNRLATGSGERMGANPPSSTSTPLPGKRPTTRNAARQRRVVAFTDADGRSRLGRNCRFELLERRNLFAADALQLGVVYLEADLGSDAHGDTFEVTFAGGAAGTQLTRLLIDGDQGQVGFGEGDVFFDTLHSGLGADDAFGFTIVSLVSQNPSASVQANVVDGTTQLELLFSGFQAGDKLTFSIDVDEVEEFDASESNLTRINDGFDPITSGIEFQGSQMTAWFTAPHYHDIQGDNRFLNRYDDLLVGTGLNLPADNANGLRDRSAGTVVKLQQTPKPVTIAGTVFLDDDLDLAQRSASDGIGGVRISLWKLQGGQYVDTGHATTTNAGGHYLFGRDLDLQPGTYQLREVQPAGLVSVGAIRGTVAGQPTGNILAGDPDRLTAIEIPLGDLDAVDYDFAEARFSCLSGSVYHDQNNNGLRDAGEQGIAGVRVQIVPLDTIAPQAAVTVVTGADGRYEACQLVPGRYKIVELDQPADYFDGLDSAGTIGGIRVGTAVNPGDRIEDIQLNGGVRGESYDFGELAPASLRGRVHLTDENGDCFESSSVSRPLADVSLRLLDASGQVVATTKTGADGRYAFTGLRPGRYTLVEVTPTGLFDGDEHPGRVAGQIRGTVAGDDRIADILLASGDAGEEYDFCESEPSSLWGIVYHDQNDNGTRDAGETPIAGAVVILKNSAGNEVGRRTTDAQGAYAFEQLPADRYLLQELQPTGWLDGKDSAGRIDGQRVGVADDADDLIEQIALGWGQSGTEYNFGELLPGSLAGIVHSDPDEDCLFDPGETLLAGVTIELLDASGRTIATTQTDTQGRYVFSDLAPGVYSVRERQPEGYFHGGQRAGSHGGNDQVSDLISGIQLKSGQQLTDYSFCETPPASISGLVHADPNQDCLYDSGEAKLANVTIELLNANGQVVRATRTDSQGMYRFDNLESGVYSVREIQPQGYFHGGQRAGSHGGDDSLDGLIGLISIDAGTTLTDYNFCELPPATLSGLVHADPNQDCLYDSGEAKLADVTIELLDANGQVIRTTRTDSQGTYRFDNLEPGVYSVRETTPAGYFDGGQKSGSHGGDDSLDGLIGLISIGPGASLTDYNFCELPPSTLSGHVFQDGDALLTEDGLPPANVYELRDGRRTPDDLPIAGVVLELRNGINGDPIDASQALPGYYGEGQIRVQTDASGYYEFLGLPPGSYAVYEIHPTDWVDGLDTPGSTSGVAVNPNGELNPLLLQQFAVHPGNDAIILIPLPAGQSSTDNDFSEIRVAKLPVDRPPPPPIPQTPIPDPPIYVPPVIVQIPLPDPPYSPPWPLELPTTGGGGIPSVTWHLSVVDAGVPRGGAVESLADSRWRSAVKPILANWSELRLREGQWLLPVESEEDDETTAVGAGQLLTDTPDPAALEKYLFGMAGAIPISGDFDGDGDSDIGIFYQGEWYIDLNGNGRWDSDDLWARLGGEYDTPITGDWDGDGKDDIGIFGPMWQGDARAIKAEPGVPDSNNSLPRQRPKNVPPTDQEATDGHRLLQRSAGGDPRGDVIDHVFSFGLPGDAPLAGDWNGDGIDSVAAFRNGRWFLDSNGDGRWSAGDQLVTFGQEGDVPVVGDWNGDGVDDLGVYRNGKWILDSNGDRKLTSHDKVFDMGGPNDTPIVGDWNGDGTDEPGLYRNLGP